MKLDYAAIVLICLLVELASCSGSSATVFADAGQQQGDAANGGTNSPLDAMTMSPGDADTGTGSNPRSEGGSGSSGGSSTSSGGSAASYVLTVDLVGAGIDETVDSSDGVIDCGPGPVTVPCSASYASGTQVTLTANVGDSAFSFGGWSGGGCSGTGSCVLTTNSTQTVTASFHAALTYTDSEDFIVPTGIASVDVQLWGGGGQGGFAGAFNASLGCYTGTGGGGGGAYNAQTLTVVAGNTYPITVGCGGCVVSSDMNQLDLGGDSSFGSLLTAGGGQGGSDSPPTGGPGGACSGPGCVAGISGNSGSSSSCNGGNGGAAGGPDGGTGGVYGSNGGDGVTPGGGGAGSEGIAGGMGAPGEAIVSW
ncbi:MAG: hypothetical protein ABTD50_16725 [Polyangiaceae bacterium]